MEKLGNVSTTEFEEFLRFQEKQKKAAEKRERKKEEKREAERKREEEEEKREADKKKEREEKKKREAEKKKEQEEKKRREEEEKRVVERKREEEEKRREADKKEQREKRKREEEEKGGEADKKKDQGEKKRREEEEKREAERKREEMTREEEKKKRRMDGKNPEFMEEDKSKGKRDGLYVELMGKEEASFFPDYLSCSSTEEDEALPPKVASKVATAPKRKLTFPEPVFGDGPKKTSKVEMGKEATTKPQEQARGPAPSLPSPSPGTLESDKLSRSISELVQAVQSIAGGLSDIARSIDHLPVLSPPPPPLSYHKSGSRGGYSQRYEKR